MSKLKSLLTKTLRWGWFGFLVLSAFAYLASGLSEPRQQHVAVDHVSVNNDDLSAAIAAVDLVRAQSLQAAALQSAPAANWLNVCRRLSLALVGNQLSLEELRQLERLPEAERATAHLANLLDDSRCHHYLAERWTRFLVGTEEGQFVVFRRRRFRFWLANFFADPANRYDQMVHALVTAEGLWTDKPEVNFLTATVDSNDGQPDPMRLAARASRTFLGLRIDCLQCHSDFLGNVSLGDVNDPRGGLQSDFHQLAAYFSSAKLSGLQGVQSAAVDYQYQYLDADKEVVVEPSVPYSTELLPPQGDPRDRLATWITHPENKQAALAAVSHFWALMFGRPLGEAVDNLPLGEETNPMLSVLADDFIEHQYDIRRLIRVIAGSAAFRADSRADFPITAAHEQHHAVFPLVRLRPEQVAGSIIQGSRVKMTDRESSLILQLNTLVVLGDFVKRYGDIGEDEFTTDAVTVTQRLLMMNGQLLHKLVEFNPVMNAATHIGMFASGNAQVVETMYLCTLNRYPTDAEKQHFVRRLAAAKQRQAAIEDMAWVLLNSSEAVWNY